GAGRLLVSLAAQQDDRAGEARAGPAHGHRHADVALARRELAGADLHRHRLAPRGDLRDGEVAEPGHIGEADSAEGAGVSLADASGVTILASRAACHRP